MWLLYRINLAHSRSDCEACVSTQDAEGCTFNIKITDRGDSTFVCAYTPVKPIKHTIIITWGEVNVPNSPFRVRYMLSHGYGM